MLDAGCWIFGYWVLGIGVWALFCFSLFAVLLSANSGGCFVAQKRPCHCEARSVEAIAFRYFAISLFLLPEVLDPLIHIPFEPTGIACHMGPGLRAKEI